MVPHLTCPLRSLMAHKAAVHSFQFMAWGVAILILRIVVESHSLHTWKNLIENLGLKVALTRSKQLSCLMIPVQIFTGWQGFCFVPHPDAEWLWLVAAYIHRRHYRNLFHLLGMFYLNRCTTVIATSTLFICHQNFHMMANVWDRPFHFI